MKKYVWGIMGLGKIAELFADAVNAIENAEMICASRTEKKAREFAEKFGAVKYYDSYEKLVADESVDVIYIATPMSCHYENVMLCLENGKNVLCEKSVTMNTAQWEELVAMARAKKLFLMEAMWMKCLPSFLKAKEWIAQGRIGEPIAVKAELDKACPFDINDRLFSKELGGGVLLDMGIYALTFSCDIFGYEPDEVISALKYGPTGVDFTDAIILKYKNGCFADLSASFEFSTDNYGFVIGTKGVIKMGPWFHCSRSAELTDNSGNTEVFDGSFICNGYEYEILEVQKCLDAGVLESTLVPHSETTAIMRLMDEIRRNNGLFYDDDK